VSEQCLSVPRSCWASYSKLRYYLVLEVPPIPMVPTVTQTLM